MTSFKIVAIANNDAILEERPRSVSVIPRGTGVVPVAITYCHRDRSVEKKNACRQQSLLGETARTLALLKVWWHPFMLLKWRKKCLAQGHVNLTRPTSARMGIQVVVLTIRRLHFFPHIDKINCDYFRVLGIGLELACNLG